MIASPMQGVVQIVPTQWELSYSKCEFAQVSITGVLMETDWQEVSKTALAGVPMIELLAEVNRRIKDGENTSKK